MKNSIFAFLALSVTLISYSFAGDNLGHQGKNGDGPSPEALLSKLKSDSEIEIRLDRNWTVATSNKHRTIWSFPPQDHPAYPSYVKREVVEKDGSIYMHTSVRCGAVKAECDKLVQDFVALNKRVKNQVVTN